MTDIVTYDKIETNTFLNVFETIDTRTYVGDPRDEGNRKNRKFVYDADPFHKAINFDNMPYIVVKFGTYEETRSSADRSRKGIKFTHQIVIRTARRGSSNSSIDQGRKDMLNITDDLRKTFNTRTVRENFKGWKMTNLKLEKIDSDDGSINQSPIYESLFELSYDTPYLNVVS